MGTFNKDLSEGQKAFFERNARFMAGLMRILESPDGAGVITRNMATFKTSNPIKTPEDLVEVALSRYIRPVFKSGGVIVPQILCVNPDEWLFVAFSYLGIYKEIASRPEADGSPRKVAGLTDVLTGLLYKRGYRIIGLVSGSEGVAGQIAWVSTCDVNERRMFRRAFLCERGEAVEKQFTWENYETVFMKTFDSDIWVDRVAWTGGVN